MTDCASSRNPAGCKMKTAAMKIGLLLAIGAGFTVLLSTGLTIFTAP